MEEIIVEAIGLELDGMKFYKERKISNKVIDEFFETEQERNRLVKIGTSYFNLTFVSRLWRFVFYVIMEYLTLDGRYTKLYGYHFVLENHFQHDIRVNFPSYLLQSLSTSTQAIQHDPTGEHVFHEGLMVLIMNVLKSKKILNPGTLKGVINILKGAFKKRATTLRHKMRPKGVLLVQKKVQVTA